MRSSVFILQITPSLIDLATRFTVFVLDFPLTPYDWVITLCAMHYALCDLLLRGPPFLWMSPKPRRQEYLIANAFSLISLLDSSLLLK